MQDRLARLALVLLATLASPLVWHSQAVAQNKVAVEKQPAMPDLSGDWEPDPAHGGAGCGWNPADLRCQKLEDGTPYQAWALEKLKSERPGFGANATFENTTDPNIKYCDPLGLPRVYFNPSKFRFVPAAETMFILYEYGPTWLPIAMNAKHPDDPDPTWWGDSIGRIEGDTLVIDSVGFNDKTWLDMVGRPHTESLHVIARYHRLDKEHLQLDVTFDDPKTYTKPWSGQKVFKLSHTGFGRYLWVCTYSTNQHFNDSVTKPTVAKP